MERSGSRDLAALAGFVGLCLVVGMLGGWATSGSVHSWYPTLHKPSFNPPDWVFAPVWTTLYVIMAVAAWRVWRLPASPLRRAALTAFWVQLALNLAWSFLFFGLRSVALGLAEILPLLAAIVITAILFWRLDRPAGALFLPYIAWVAFASLLNLSLFLLNAPKV